MRFWVGQSYEYYDLLRTDMIRCKKAKDFNIYNPVYGNTSKCTTVSASDSDQTIKQERPSAYAAQDALYLTDNWIAVAGSAISITRSMRVKAVLLMSILTVMMNNGLPNWGWFTN